MLLEDAETKWVLIPHSIVDGEVVYKKCRVTSIMTKSNRWGPPEEILNMYADFVHDKNEGLVSLKEQP